MRMVKYIIAFAAATFLALPLMGEEGVKSDNSPSSGSPKVESINWLSYGEALAKSTADSVHVFIDFWRTGCGWCKRMEQTTYTDTVVIRMLNENYASVRIQGDSGKELDIEGYKISERALAIHEFGVSAYPQFWFLTPDRGKVGPLKGYLPADRFLKALEYIKDYQYDTTRTSQSDTKEAGEK